jgi:hypothetical protein
MKRNSTFLAKALTLLFVSLFSLTEARAQQTLPYEYGFENNNLAADGWVLQGANSTSTGIISTAARSGSNGFRFNYSERNAYLISPLLSGDAFDLSFWYKEYSSSYGDEQFQVGYTTDASASDASAFTYGDVVTASTSWQEYTQSFPAGTKRIAIKYIYTDAFYLFLDDFSFVLPAPRNLTASHVTATSANISWDGDADSYNLRYVTATGGASFFEDFENGLDAQGWTTIRNAAGNENTDWRTFNPGNFQDPIPAHSGDNIAMSRSWASSAYSVDNWLISPKVTLGGIMTYWVMDDGTYHEHYDIYVSTTTTDISAFTKVYEPGNASGSWTMVTVDLSSFAGQEGYVAFRHTDNDQDFLFIDDVTISVSSSWTTINNVTSPYALVGLTPETPYAVEVQAVYADGVSEWINTSFTTTSATAVPTDLAATDVKATSATLDWAGSQDSYNLQYREVLPIDPTAPATIIFTAGDVWGDGSGYQMLLDADATAFGDVFTETGGWTATDFSAFEYTIPTDAECDVNTTAVVYNNSVTIQVPAGTYDWCILNPSPDYDNIYIAAQNGNVGGRQNDYVFEAGKTYEFVPSIYGSNDGIDVTITYPVGEWTVVENVTAPYELTGLAPETNYEWQVQGILSDGTTEWSELSSFTTPEITTIPVTISSVGYSTLYYGTLNLVVPEGVTASTYSYADSKIQVSKTYDAGDVIPAGEAVVLQANAGTYEFVVTTEAGEADESNALRGSDEAEQTTGGDVYYALSLKDGANIGFYWMAEGGAAFTNGAHKAYLALTNTRVKGFAIGLEDDATAIETIANGQQTTEGAIYNVAGQRLNKAQKGVNIVNGKKIAIK